MEQRQQQPGSDQVIVSSKTRRKPGDRLAAARLLPLLATVMLLALCEASVRGAPPRRFTFLKRLRPRIRGPVFRRLRTDR